MGVFFARLQHLLVADQRALGPVPRADQPETNASGLHGLNREFRLVNGETGIFNFFQGRLAPTMERMEDRVAQVSQGRVLHPRIDDRTAREIVGVHSATAARDRRRGIRDGRHFSDRKLQECLCSSNP